MIVCLGCCLCSSLLGLKRVFDQWICELIFVKYLVVCAIHDFYFLFSFLLIFAQSLWVWLMNSHDIRVRSGIVELFIYFIFFEIFSVFISFYLVIDLKDYFTLILTFCKVFKIVFDHEVYLNKCWMIFAEYFFKT